MIRVYEDNIKMTGDIPTIVSEISYIIFNLYSLEEKEISNKDLEILLEEALRCAKKQYEECKEIKEAKSSLDLEYKKKVIKKYLNDLPKDLQEDIKRILF